MKTDRHYTGKHDAFGNAYVQKNDRMFYKEDKNGRLYETGETARLRAQAEHREEQERKQREEEMRPDPVPAGPSAYDQGVDAFTGGLGNAFADAAKMTATTILAVLALGTFFAVKRTYDKALAENPDDKESARAKAGRTALCSAGMLANFILLFVLALVFDAIQTPAVHNLGSIVLIFQFYAFYGLVRVAGGKPFLINPAAICRKIRSIKVPKIAYAGIELLTTVLMTKPVLNFINSFTFEWAAQHQDAEESLILTIGLAMLAASILIAALIGWIVCKLVKAVTAK